MKIEKESTKIVAQKKVQPKPEAKPEAKPESQPEPKPEVNTPSQPTPKVTSQTDAKKISEAEDIKSKREQLFEKARIEQMQIRKNAIEAKKRRRVFQITSLVTLAILLLFAPIYPNQETKMNKHYYLKDSDIQIDHPLGKHFSPFQYLRFESEVKNGSEYIKSASVKYKLREMQVVVNIEEYKPLAKDVENNIYFYEEDQVIKKSDINLYAPIITGFDQKTLESLLKNLKSLDYDVIMQIDTIEYIGTEEDPDLLKLGMDGDNTVYIDISQIKTKLPYYNQIKQIIDEKADGQPGVIHLDIGDYYEPK